MTRLIRVTEPTLDVVEVLLHSRDAVWGLAIAKTVDRAPGTIYPILARLEELGWLTGEWEGDSDHPGPRRRLYRLTDDDRGRFGAPRGRRRGWRSE